MSVTRHGSPTGAARAVTVTPGLDAAGLRGLHDRLSARTRRASALLFLGAHGGWGYCMAAPGPVSGEPPIPRGFGWNGGTGTVWSTDPVRGITGILLTTRAMTSPDPPVHFVDVWEAAYGALAD